MNARRPLRLLLAMVPLVRCSLMGFDAFDLPHCSSNLDCDGLNVERAVPSDGCQRYQCVLPERQCQLVARDQDGDGDVPVSCGGTDCDDANPRRNGARASHPLAETCDHIDNNCNQITDEGVWLGPPVNVGSVPAPVATASSATREDGRTAICTTTAAGIPSFSILDGQHLDTGLLRYEARIPGDGAMQQVVDRCPVLVGSGTFGLGTCNAVEAVAAPLDAGRWFVATLNTNGCGRGQVRVGWMGESDRRLVLDAVGSPLAAGVDISLTEPCTGASRTGPMRGAASLTIASIPAMGAAPARAVVTWLAVDRTANVCGESKAIEGIVVTVTSHRTSGGGTVDAVVPMGDGRVLAIGSTMGTNSSALAAVPERDVIALAFGDVEGHSTIRTISTHNTPMLDAPRTVATTHTDVNRVGIWSETGGAGYALLSMSGCSSGRHSILRVDRETLATSSLLPEVAHAAASSFAAVFDGSNLISAIPSQAGETAWSRMSTSSPAETIQEESAGAQLLGTRSSIALINMPDGNIRLRSIGCN